jgi:hypothetical protein
MRRMDFVLFEALCFVGEGDNNEWFQEKLGA